MDWPEESSCERSPASGGASPPSLGPRRLVHLLRAAWRSGATERRVFGFEDFGDAHVSGSSDTSPAFSGVLECPGLRCPDTGHCGGRSLPRL